MSFTGVEALGNAFEGNDGGDGQQQRNSGVEVMIVCDQSSEQQHGNQYIFHINFP